MKFNILKASAVALLAISPVAAHADAIAASLSASFGSGGQGLFRPQSLSVAVAAGDTAAAGAVAHRNATGAVAGASEVDGLTPSVKVELGSRGRYETSVSFQSVVTAQDILDLRDALDDLTDRVDANEDALESLIANICGADGVDVGEITTSGEAVTGVSFSWQSGVSLVRGLITIEGPTVSLNCGLN